MAIEHPFTLAFGLLGNIISFLVFLAPAPTFYTIYKRKTAEGFQALPYVIALLSCMLLIYYAYLKQLLKQEVTLLVTINSIGCVVEAVYISLFLFYAPKRARISTVKLLVFLNGFSFGMLLVLTHFLIDSAQMRHKIVGWICLVFSVCVFVAPLGVLRQVIRTKSVDFMPFPLSFFLTLGAVAWFLYGFTIKDYNIAFPNILGFFFGVVQMVLYVVYKKAKKVVVVVEDHQPKVQELPEHIIDVMKISNMVCPELTTPVAVLQPNVEITNDMISEVVQSIIVKGEKTKIPKIGGVDGDDDATTKV